MKVSEELRKWCDKIDHKREGFWNLRELADRIDSEMVELPKDRDGAPIHVGDTVYLDDGRTAKVTRIGIGIDEDSIYAIVYGDNSSFLPECSTHIKPDSWESIADELDQMVDSADSADDNCERLANLADRIRRLAAKKDAR